MSLTTPFEVKPKDDGFIWELISPAGRVLAYALAPYATQRAAADAAKAARAEYHALALPVDGGNA